MRRFLLLCSALGLATGVACGGGQTRIDTAFSTDWQDDHGAGVRAVWSKVATNSIAPGAAVAVGAIDNGLVGVPLSGGARWSFSHPLSSRPAVAGSVVVAMGGSEIVALDALTGRVLWSKRGTGELRGIGDDGKTTVLSLGRASDAGSLLLAVSHDGTVLRQLETRPAIGVPAVVGTYAFFPWQNQYVTIYNLSSGVEEARLLFREQVSRAFTHEGKLYFGELGLFRFDERVPNASVHQASHVSLPALKLPGDPTWFVPATDPRPLEADARDKIELFGEPSTGEALALAANTFVATYYRIAVGLDARSGGVTWTQRLGADAIGGDAFPRGVALCNADGDVSLFSLTDGAKIGSASLGRRVKTCVVQADGVTAARVGEPDRPPLADQIAEAVDLGEADLLAIHRVLLRALAKLDDPKATKVLIDWASDPRTAPPLLADTDPALSARRNGPEYMLQALERHYDFLRDILRPPPVGPLADALGGMKETRAAPLLVSHLFDPADPPSAVRRAAAALEQIATASELPKLRTFFALYRTTADDDEMAQAVTSVARVLVKLGNADDKVTVARAAEDPMTVAYVKTQLEVLAK
jgi:outer membrane protein assembly factor BamB